MVLRVLKEVRLFKVTFILTAFRWNSPTTLQYCLNTRYRAQPKAEDLYSRRPIDPKQHIYIYMYTYIYIQHYIYVHTTYTYVHYMNAY